MGSRVRLLSSLFAAACAAAAAPAPPVEAPPPQPASAQDTAAVAIPAATLDSVRLDGEYGLWVRHSGDSIVVSWITRRASSGFLQVYSGDRLRFRGTTPVDSVHRAKFPYSRDRVLTLRYGAVGDSADEHETAIRRDDGDRKPRVEWGSVDSVVVVSDIHGEFDRLVDVLQNAGMIDESLRWSGGRKSLVVVGDVFDRGEDATRVLWFLYGLEPQAERAGGRLHVVLGNHEIMVMLGDLRYVSSKEQRLADLYGVTYDRLFRPGESLLARWLTGRPALLRLGDALFAHGGVTTDYLGWNLRSFEDTLHAYTHEDLFNRWTDSTYIVPMDSVMFQRRLDFFWGIRSVFWYRGYVQSDSLGNELGAVLDRFDAGVLVVGHTPLPTITQRYGGRLIDVNTLPFASEALLLVRRRDGWDRYRIRESGPPELLEEAAF